MKTFRNLVSVMLLAFIPYATAQDDIVDVAVNNGSFTTLVAAVQAAGLEDTLRGEGPFTVFAPTDDAFAALPEGTVEALLNDIPTLTDILLYHVVAGAVDAATVVTLDSATTVLGEDVTITVTDAGVQVNGANVIITDVPASNGIIHVIDAVLLPPEPEPELDDIVDTAIAAGGFETLVAAVQAAGLEDTLRSEGPFTVFAPTDDAFAALPEGTVEALLNDIPTLTDILLYHVVSGAVDAATVVTLDSATTVLGEDVTITVTDGGVMINDSNVIITDIETSNGIIHVIDAVLLPPEPEPELLDIVDTAVAAGSFNTLVAAVQAAGLEETLRSEGPFTVFAPTDDAFAALPEGTVEALLNDIPALTDILLYHVVSGAVDAETVVTLESATTVLGEDVTITVTENGVMINDANVIITDVEATNGIIHVIDAVLLPPEPEPMLEDIVDTAIAAGDFTTLVAAVQAAGLEDALRGDGPLTVFAPTDAAFAALPEGTVEALLGDIPTLTDILLYHVTDGARDAAYVTSRNSLLMLQGDRAAITVDDNGAFINQAQIVITDIPASNGIIHVIDAVILPPEDEGLTYEVTVTNITKGQVFSPPLIVSHGSDVSPFQLGGTASAGLKLMAEDGNSSDLADEYFAVDGIFDIVQTGAPLAPGASETWTVQATGRYNQISVLGMLVSTNDAFFSATATAPSDLSGLFKRAGIPAYNSATGAAYDAGTEYNSESCADIPGPPCGNAGVSPAEAGEGYIYISNGISGKGDLSADGYDWRNPTVLIKVRLIDP